MSFSRNANSDSFKKQYQKSLQNNLLLHPKAIKARTINAINTINTNKSTIQKYNINYKPKNVISKEVYSKYKNIDFQEKHPFGVTDTKRYCHGTINTTSAETSRQLSQRDYHYPKHKDNLEGGIGMFMNTKQHQNNSIDLTKKNLMIKKLNTKRVIIPNCDNNIKCALRKRRNKSSDVIQRYSEGSFESLMNKTPNSFDGKGKKIVKGYSNKSHDIFSNEFLNGDGKCNVFGMHRRKKRNLNIRRGLSCDNGNNGINKNDDYAYNRSLMSKNTLTITRDSISGRNDNNNNNTINTTSRFHRRNVSLPLKTISYM
jgi:hypothetical protein